MSRQIQSSCKHPTHPPATWLAKLISRADRPAGLAELLRPRLRLPMGTSQRVLKAALARGHFGAGRWFGRARWHDDVDNGGDVMRRARAAAMMTTTTARPATVLMTATTLEGFRHALAATRACDPRIVFCTGFAPWAHDRASRVHRAVT